MPTSQTNVDVDNTATTNAVDDVNGVGDTTLDQVTKKPPIQSSLDDIKDAERYAFTGDNNALEQNNVGEYSKSGRPWLITGMKRYNNQGDENAEGDYDINKLKFIRPGWNLLKKGNTA